MVEPKLYEIESLVRFSTVVLANSEEEAMDTIRNWSATDFVIPGHTDAIDVIDVDLANIREGSPGDAHIVADEKREEGGAE